MSDDEEFDKIVDGLDDATGQLRKMFNELEQEVRRTDYERLEDYTQLEDLPDVYHAPSRGDWIPIWAVAMIFVTNAAIWFWFLWLVWESLT